MLLAVIIQKDMTMPEVTFETLPQAVTLLLSKVTAIAEQLEKLDGEAQPEPDRWFNLDEFCQYHPDKPSKYTAYGWVHENRVPYHKSEKKLRFLKSEIDAWLLRGRVKTLAEAGAEAEAYLRERAAR